MSGNDESGSFIYEAKTEGQPTLRPPRPCCSQLYGVLWFALGLLGGILIGIYAFHGGMAGEVTCFCKNLPAVETTILEDNDICPRSEPRTPWDGIDPEIFAPLTTEEMISIRDFMRNNGYISATDPVIGDPASLKTTYIQYMYLYPPNKDAVLKYKRGDWPYPGRHATVHVVRGDRKVPDYMLFKVGPLNTNDITAVQLYTDGELHFNSRPTDEVDLALYVKILCRDFQILESLLKESFDGASCSDESPDFIFNMYYGPPGLRSEEREFKSLPYLNELGGEEFLFNILPIAATVHSPGTEFSNWYVHDYYYLNQGPFPNASSLLDAYNNGTIRKFALPTGFRQTVLDRHLIDRDPNAPFRDRAHIPPPRTYEPEGPRYKIKGHHVDWMGWSFDVTSSQLRGPGLFCITYKGESIAYELSLNEIAIIYGFGAAGATDIIFGDSVFGLGTSPGIVKTVDCPEHATLLETSYWDSLVKPSTHKTICIFEADGENALARHKGSNFEGGLRNNFLVIRTQVVIGNYDYIIEWHFYLDGRIYTIGGASGYIFGGFWDSENPFIGMNKNRDAFGYKIDLFTHGKMHDHMFGFKVDLDIVGTENTMEVIHWKSGDVLAALRTQVPSIDKVPPFFQHNTTSYVEFEYIEEEQGYRLNYEKPEFWLVVNEDRHNKWGVERGYQIHPLSTAAQTMSNSHPAMDALSFSKYHCAVTKRKEGEQYLSYSSDVFRFDKPIGAFDRMLNNEAVRKTDIVNWVTVGLIHLPTSEDVPMTDRVETGFMLKPFNFFNRTDIFDLQVYFNLESSRMNKTERPPSVTPCKEHILYD